MKYASLLLAALIASACDADELVVVTSPRCQPCQNLKRDLGNKPELYRPHSLVVLEGKKAIAVWKVTAVPTLIRVKGGIEVARQVGYNKPEEVAALMGD